MAALQVVINKKEEQMNIVPASVVPDNSVNITVPDFLEGVFRGNWRQAWVCTVPEADHPDWKGASAEVAQLDGPGWANQNCYYSVGLMEIGATSRQDVNWVGTQVIVVDDVVEKADADRVRLYLGDPSFIVQTSPGSQQWGYILDAVLDDRDTQARIMRAITEAFFNGIEPGHRDLTRYVRLPVGINNKASRVAANGGTAPDVRCVEWNPERLHSWKDLADRLTQVSSATAPALNAWKAAEGAKAGQATTHKPVSVSEVQGFIAAGDCVLAMFDALGMVRGEQGNGYLEVECPWADTHTKADDRTGWSPVRFLSGQTGFKCMHSDGAGGDGRRDHEVADVLRERLDTAQPGAWADVWARNVAQANARAVQTFGAAPVSPSQAGMLAVQTAVAAATGTTPPALPPTDWVSFGMNAPTSPIPQRERIADGFARGEVSYITAQPAAGKSAIGCVALPLAMASGRHDLFGEPQPFDRAGDVYVVSNEDNADMVRKRAKAWMMQTRVQRSDMKHDTVVNVRQGFVAVRKADRMADVKLSEDMVALGDRLAAARAAGRDTAMVILDTQATVFAGINENDNGDAGAVGRLLTAWAKDQNVSLVIVHHMPKANGHSGGGGDQGSVRGASAFAGMMRNGVTLVGLSDEEKKRLRNPADRDSWVKYEGSKASHSAKASSRWFRKYIMHVPVEDARRPGQPATDPTPCFIADQHGPDFGFNPTGEEAMFRVCEVIGRMDAAGAPLRVNSRGGAKGGPRVRAAGAVLADEISEADAKTAKQALEEAKRLKLVEVKDGARSMSSNRKAKVYRLTQDGAALVEKRRAEMSDMDTHAPSDSSAADDDDCPI